MFIVSFSSAAIKYISSTYSEADTQIDNHSDVVIKICFIVLILFAAYLYSKNLEAGNILLRKYY